MASPPPGRARSFALATLCISLLAVATAYVSAFIVRGGGAWSAPAFVLGVSGATGSMMALGAARRGRLGILGVPIVLTVAIVTVGLLAAWAMPAEAEPLWLGLPRRAAIVLYGVGMLPAFVLPLAYALTFDRFTLQEEDLARIRAIRAASEPLPVSPDERTAEA